MVVNFSALSQASAGALSAGSVVRRARSRLASKGKHPVESVSLAKRSKRLEGVRSTYLGRYAVAELLLSITDTEDDGVEFCWRDEA
jgi:hypothetical protein